MALELGATPWVVLRGQPVRTGGFRIRMMTGGGVRRVADDFEELRPVLDEEAGRLRRPDTTLPIFSDIAIAGFLVAVLAADRPSSWTPPRHTLIRLRGARWSPRPGLALPLEVLIIGAPELEAASHASAAHTVQNVEVGDLRQRLGEGSADVAICAVDEVPAVLDAVTRAPAVHRPRLVLGEPDGDEVSPQWAGALHVPPGVALAIGTTRHAYPFAGGVLLGIAGDLPVHDAARLADASAIVVADPATNDGLRVEHVVIDLLDRGREVVTTTDEAAFETLGERLQLDPEVPTRTTDLLRGLQKTVRPLRARLLDLDDRATMRLTRGIEPSASGGEVLGNLVGAAPGDIPTGRISWPSMLPQAGEVQVAISAWQDQIDKVRTELVADDAFVASLQRHRERRVDLALRAPPDEPAALPDQRLQRGERRLVVCQIGKVLDDSLLPERPPPVDLILPEPEGAQGHDLEVTVFGLDFAVEGETTRPLHLPQLAPSDAVEIPVVAPAEPTALARLRVALYQHNHLVQSFILTTGVGDEGPPPAFVLDFSRSERLTDLDELPPRAMSIAVNASPDGGHNLMLKSSAGDVSVPFSSDVVNENLEATRKLLREMKASLPGASRLSVPQAPWAADNPELARWWVKLARRGELAYQDLLVLTGTTQEQEMERLEQLEDEVVQIARIDAGFAYPWPLVYDWMVPINDGDEATPVCFGDPDEQGRRRCGHGSDSGVVCVYGFWGVRMQLEQVLTLSSEGRKRPVRAAPGAPRIRLALGVRDDWTNDLQKALDAMTPTEGFSAASTAALAQELWQAELRPEAIVVVAHHVDAPGDDDDRRDSCLELDGRKVMLSHRHVFQQLQRSRSWAAPNSVVLLMACESGAVTSSKLDDFATLFVRAGAGGVVASEVDIGTDLASRCAHDITAALLGGQAFSAALLRFNRGLAHLGSPFGFSFTWLGEAELEVARA